jgi:hypothetical protein
MEEATAADRVGEMAGATNDDNALADSSDGSARNGENSARGCGADDVNADADDDDGTSDESEDADTGPRVGTNFEEDDDDDADGDEEDDEDEGDAKSDAISGGGDAIIGALSKSQAISIKPAAFNCGCANSTLHSLLSPSSSS